MSQQKNMSSPTPSLNRRTSLADRIQSAIPRPRLNSLRSRKSNASLNGKEGRPHSYAPYSVHQQAMLPAIIRDQSATSKLLEAILDTPGGRRSVARLGRTCKALKDPALDLLWKDLDSITPLIGLFPSTLHRRARRPGLGLARNPEPDDWSALLAYGERVRTISYVESSGSISPSIFPILEDLRPRQWILPNLQSVNWKTETSAGLDRVRLFLGPELQAISLEVGTKHPKLSDLLIEIASHPKLKSLSINLHTNLPDNFTDIFQNNIALERVALQAPGALSPKVGRWVSTLPKLRNLELDLTGRDKAAVEGFFDNIAGSGNSTPDSVGGTDSGVFSADEFDFSEIRKSVLLVSREGPRHRAFGKLAQLSLSGEAANIAMFLRHLAVPLKQLELAIDDPPVLSDWQEVCNLLCEHHSHTLQGLRIGPTSAARFSELVRSTSRGGDAPIHHLPLTHFDALPRLRRLEIDLPESVVFYDVDIEHVARCCPELEILRLCPMARFSPSVGAPALTLDNLAHLTRLCRRLHTLAITLNALEGSRETFASLDASSRSLLRLQVGHSWIKDPLQTTILLSHLAPYLETLRFFNEKNRAGIVEANALAWQKVADLLPALQGVRLAERHFQERYPPSVLESSIPEEPVYIPPTMVDEEIDATVEMVDESVTAMPELVSSSVQAEVEVADLSVQASPETTMVSIDATPEVVDEEISAIPEVMHDAVVAQPDTVEKAVDHHRADEMAEASESSTDSEDEQPRHGLGFIPGVSNLISLGYFAVHLYTMPVRYVFSFMPSLSLFSSTSPARPQSEPKTLPSQNAQEDASEKHQNGLHESNLMEYISPACQ